MLRDLIHIGLTQTVEQDKSLTKHLFNGEWLCLCCLFSQVSRYLGDHKPAKAEIAFPDPVCKLVTCYLTILHL